MPGVPPLAGRTLLETDEQPGAPAVVVLGYTMWQHQFGGSADAIGQTVQLGKTRTTIVGIMPEGFAFPINHRLWIPLQLRSSGYAPLEGPAIRVFGRLAPGATQAQANTEFTSLTEALAAPRHAPTNIFVRESWPTAASRPVIEPGSSSR